MAVYFTHPFKQQSFREDSIVTGRKGGENRGIDTKGLPVREKKVIDSTET